MSAVRDSASWLVLSARFPVVDWLACSVSKLACYSKKET